MKNKKTLSTLIFFGVGVALFVTSFYPSKVLAGGGWEINKKSATVTCSSVTVKGSTNAPFVNIKVWGSKGTENLLTSSMTATQGDTSNAQVADFRASVQFPLQPNGTPIHFQVAGYYIKSASGQVNAAPISGIVNCVDTSATPTPAPTASIAPTPLPSASAIPLATASPTTTQALPWWARIWQQLTGWLKR